MKKILLLLICTITLSCNKGGLVDESKSDSYFYSTDKKKIFYKQTHALDITRLWNYTWLEVPTDVKTFRVMEGGFGKDDKHIFFVDRIVENVDYHTFRDMMDNRHYIDKDNVYTRSLEIVKDANPVTYEVLKDGGVDYGNYIEYVWAKDDKHYFYRDSIIPVDYNSFKILTSDIMADKDFIYNLEDRKAFKKYPNKNGTSSGFTILSSIQVHTDRYFYYGKSLVSKDDFLEIEVKDPNSIKLYGWGSYFTIDGEMYFHALKMENADPTTFEVFNKDRGTDFAKDKNHFYLRSKIYPNVNPNEIKYDAKENEFSYRGKLWNWETEKFDLEAKRNRR